MAGHCFPDRAPIGQGINLGGNLPLRPSRSAPLYPIDLHDQVTEDALVHIQQIPGWCQIIQLCNAMESQIPLVRRVGARRFDDGSGGTLRDGNMIWMPVASIGAEGDDHIRLHAPQVPGDLCHHFGWVGLVQLAINIPQKINAANAKDFGRRSQFSLTHLTQHL